MKVKLVEDFLGDVSKVYTSNLIVELLSLLPENCVFTHFSQRAHHHKLFMLLKSYHFQVLTVLLLLTSFVPLEHECWQQKFDLELPE